MTEQAKHGVLFDFGGTIDTNGVHWSEKFWDWYSAFRMPVEKRAYERAFVASDEALLRHPGISGATFRRTLELQLAEQFRVLGLKDPGLLPAVLDAGYRDIRAIVGRAETLLRELHGRYRLALVSNFYGNLETVCREFHLDDIFDTLVDSGRVGVKKPDPEIFRIALRTLGLKPEDAYIVGDSYERDIVPGKNLGCRTVWLKGRSWTQHPAHISAADHIITSFEELRKLLL